jgi:hypothetical protein
MSLLGQEPHSELQQENKRMTNIARQYAAAIRFGDEP